METSLLGQLLVKRRLLTPTQLAVAVTEQAKSKPRRLLGDLLVEKGLIPRETLDHLVAAQSRTQDLSRVQARASNADLADRLSHADAAGFLKVARQLDATDLILSSGQRPMLRLHGALVDLPVDPLSLDRAKHLTLGLLGNGRLEEYERERSVVLPLDIPGAGRFRLSVFRHYQGIAGTFRVIAAAPWGFDRLGLPAACRRFADFSHGLVLVTGPMASGKTTTLAAYVDLLNKSRNLHIVTIEQPVEVVHRSDRCLISQRQVGRDTASYPEALRSALREDPDVIVVGEMKDPDSVSTALTAAETGHLVFGTMHTPGAHRAILRLLDQFPAGRRAQVRSMLANSLRAVIAQHLLPDVDGRGLSLAAEVLVANAAVSSLIREDRIWQVPMIMQAGGPEGMRLLDDALWDLVERRRVSYAEALARTTDRERFLAR